MLPLGRTQGHLWAHSSEPLRQPLLKQVHANAELRDPACQIFIDILPRPAWPRSVSTPHAQAPAPPCEGHGPRERRAEAASAHGAGRAVWGQGQVRGSRRPSWHILLDSHTHPPVHG